MRTGPDTYGRKSDAERALTLIEAQMMAGEWTDPDRGKVKLADYAATWIAERPGLRVSIHGVMQCATRRRLRVFEPLVQVEHAWGSCLRGLAWLM